MAVVTAHRKTELTQAEYTPTIRKYVDLWLVEVDDPTDGAAIAIQAADLPERGDAYPDDIEATCANLRAQMHGDRLHYYIYVTYDTEDRATPDPLDDPVQIEWGHHQITEALASDKDGTAILNSAEDYFDPPLEMDMLYPTVRIVYNVSVADWSPAIATAYAGAVNTDTVTIAGATVTARQALMLEFTGTLAEREGIQYYEVVHQIAFHPDPDIPPAPAGTAGWDRVVLDQGLNQIVAGKKTLILLDDGEETTRPVLLDGAGKRLAVGGVPVYKAFRCRKEVAFAALNLPRYKDGSR